MENDIVFNPRSLYFNLTSNGQWRVFFVDKLEALHMMVLSNNDGKDMLEWLDSGQTGNYTINDGNTTIVIDPSKSPLSWNVNYDALKQWRRKLAAPKVSYS